MLDTDTCIYLKNRRPPGIEERFRTLQYGEVVMSLITYGELCNGAKKSRESVAAMDNVKLLGRRVPVQPMAIDSAEIYADIRSFLEKGGVTIGGNDLWIAAHALALDLILVTNNTREFNRVPGLKIDNWV